MGVDKATKILTLDKAKSQGTKDKFGKQDNHNMQHRCKQKNNNIQKLKINERPDSTKNWKHGHIKQE